MIIEPSERNYSAYLPDSPGCIARSKTIELHCGLREDALPIPEPASLAEYVETFAIEAPKERDIY